VPKRCLVCTHPRREEVDRAIARGEPYVAISRVYGISRHSIGRHAKLHLPVAVREAARTQLLEHGGTILDQVRRLNAKALQLLDEAAAQRRYTGAAAFLKEARELLTLEARLLGELDGNRVEVHTHLDVRALAVRIARELEDEPELAERVGRVLMELTDGR
jgi:hypothetical protein